MIQLTCRLTWEFRRGHRTRSPWPPTIGLGRPVLAGAQTAFVPFFVLVLFFVINQIKSFSLTFSDS